MKTRSLPRIALAVVLAVLLLGSTRIGSLSSEEGDVLAKALRLEHRTLSVLKCLRKEVEEKAPLARILRDERRLTAVLAGLCSKYGIPLPAAPQEVASPSGDSLETACELALQLKKEKTALCRESKRMVANPELRQALAALIEGSRRLNRATLTELFQKPDDDTPQTAATTADERKARSRKTSRVSNSIGKRDKRQGSCIASEHLRWGSGRGMCKDACGYTGHHGHHCNE